MLLLSLLSFFLVPACWAISRETAYSDFIDAAASNGGVIDLTTQTFDLLTASDREWSATIQLTALGNTYKCAPCKQFEPSFKTVAKAWSKVAPKHRDNHFFATLDFANGPEVFRRLGLNSAPFVYTYPAAQGDRVPANGKVDPIPFDFTVSEFDPKSFSEGISRFTPVKIPYKPPTDFKPIVSAIVAILTLSLGYRVALPLLLNRWFWAILSIGSSLIFISGFMFVRIRGNPYVAAGSGGAQWIAPGYQNQFGMEVQVVAFIYGILTFSFLSMTLFVPRLPSKGRQTLAVGIWSGVTVIVFSVLIGFFKLKNGGYPFRLLF
ncbi:oligosaccharyl transferase subunit OST3/OST6 family [Sistotremastrum niveocremeum HHB9708]|uniref:Oligosaccharyl transferase subunit OST3/OST6 family n=2 Tax=Sistotremastraceae TaxID=3402574 RepID=A0A165AM02_9AGAM|nr:oligosaccharyl transferase subunit OST3/OST6 family [Sistotremastrum niveocremeum HHB9708]KZT42074.1 hypothetical protein SISSUDRAFT_1069610 [Sistotremastrum suecicum HHB10207 ss-3]